MRLPVFQIILATSFLLPAFHSPVQAVEPSWQVAKTEFGHPDLQGMWSNRTQTPIARPQHLGNKLTYTDEEALELEKLAQEAKRIKSEPLDPDRPAPEIGFRIRQQADRNFTDIRMDVLKVKGEYRTSMIVDPPDGQFPYKEGYKELDIYGKWRAAGHGTTDGPEIRPVAERCLSRGVPPMTVPPYNANFQIVQTQDYVMILGEMVHDARIIKLKGGHRPGNIKTWLGDSVGHWKGDTLVVRTINFRPEISHFRVTSSGQMVLDERFEIIGKDEIFYSFTVTDPEIYTRPFTEELTLRRRSPGEQIYEYACHEGNYSFAGILGGARRAEVDAQQN